MSFAEILEQAKTLSIHERKELVKQLVDTFDVSEPPTPSEPEEHWGKSLNRLLDELGPYTIELTPDEDGVWFASIPLLKGCMTQGDSREDALVMLDEAKELWLETSLAEGIPIPEPAPVMSS